MENGVPGYRIFESLCNEENPLGVQRIGKFIKIRPIPTRGGYFFRDRWGEKGKIVRIGGAWKIFRIFSLKNSPLAIGGRSRSPLKA